MECRTIEEYVRGPDGDEDKGLAGTLARIQAEARREAIARVQVEIRVTAPGSASRQEGVTSFQATDPPLSLLDALQRRLEESPGDGFTGELRLNFRALGDTRAHLGSYTRRMRPASLALEDDGPGGADHGPDVAALVVGYVRPFADLALRAFENSVQLQGAAANLVVATARIVHPPSAPPGPSGSSPVVHDLLRGALNLASVAGGKVGAAAQAGATLLPAPAPPPGPVVVPPGPDEGAPFPAPGMDGGGNLTSDDVAAWARSNPAEAEALVFRLMQERNA